MFSTFFHSVPVVVEPDQNPFEPMGAGSAILLYQLSSYARDWMAEPELYDRCWRADLGSLAPAEFQGSPWRGLAMRFRVLTPLIEFGLMESDGDLISGTNDAPPRYRITPLFELCSL